MINDAKAQLAAALRQDDHAAPLSALPHAIGWAAESLTVGADLDEVAALHAVHALSDVMPALTELLGLLPGWCRRRPGPPVTDRVAGYTAELSRQQAWLEAERAALEQPQELKQQIATAKGERALLRSEIEELSRGRQLMAELPGLRARREQLAAAVSDAEVKAGEQALARPYPGHPRAAAAAGGPAVSARNRAG